MDEASGITRLDEGFGRKRAREGIIKNRNNEYVQEYRRAAFRPLGLPDLLREVPAAWDIHLHREHVVRHAIRCSPVCFR